MGRTAKASTKIRRVPKSPAQPSVSGIDATPERIAQGSSDIVVALIDKAGERPGKARKFRSSQLDRLHKAGVLSYAQWYAGDWYRSTQERCQFSMSVVGSYGERSGSSDNPGMFGYGLPRQEAQVRARMQIRTARQQFTPSMTGFMDRFLLHDALPRYGGRAAMRTVEQIKAELQLLATHLRIA